MVSKISKYRHFRLRFSLYNLGKKRHVTNIILYRSYASESVNSSCAKPSQAKPPHPRSTAGICRPCQSRRWGICKFCTRGFLLEYNYTEDFTGKTRRLAHLSRTGKKMKRFVKACSRFYACISSLLIKPELHNRITNRELSTWINVFWVMNQISVDTIEEHPLIFIKLFITVNFRIYSALLILMSIILFITILKP